MSGVGAGGGSGRGKSGAGARAATVVAASIAAALLALPARAADGGKPREPGSADAEAEGYTVRSADGDFSVRLRPLVQFDGRFFLNDESDLGVDTFVARRVRAGIDGTVFKYFAFTILPDIGEASDQPLLDTYVELRPRAEIGLRAGRFRAPVGLEALQSAASLFVLERSLATQLVPLRDLGVQLQGELFGGLDWAVGIFDGAPDGGNITRDFDDNKELDGRLFAFPFRKAGLRPLEKLGLGLGGSWGHPHGIEAVTGLPSYKTAGGLRFFAYRSGDGLDETAIAAGERWRIAPQASWFWGPLGLLAEYVFSSQRVALADAAAQVENTAWQLALAYVFGADARYGLVVPRSPMGEGGLGALQLSARVAGLAVDPDAFPRFADPNRAASDAFNVGGALSWLLNRALAVRLSFDATSFEGGAADGDRPTEYLLTGRLQAAF